MLRSDSKVFLGGEASRTKPCRSFVGWADPGLPTRFSGGWNRRVLLEQPALTGRSRRDNRCRSSGLFLEPSPEGDPVAIRKSRRPSPKRGGRASPKPRPGGRPRRSEDRGGAGWIPGFLRTGRSRRSGPRPKSRGVWRTGLSGSRPWKRSAETDTLEANLEATFPPAAWAPKYPSAGPEPEFGRGRHRSDFRRCSLEPRSESLPEPVNRLVFLFQEEDSGGADPPKRAGTLRCPSAAKPTGKARGLHTRFLRIGRPRPRGRRTGTARESGHLFDQAGPPKSPKAPPPEGR